MVGTQRSLEMIGMLVIGGEATLAGPIIGVVLLTLLPAVFQPFALYKTLAAGALLIAFFLYMPQGILGTLVNAFSWIDRREPKPGDPIAGEIEGPAA